MKMYEVTDNVTSALIRAKETMIHTPANHFFGREFFILADGCYLPTGTSHSEGERVNNAIIIESKTDEMVFIQRRFLREVRYCSRCGHHLPAVTVIS